MSTRFGRRAATGEAEGDRERHDRRQGGAHGSPRVHALGRPPVRAAHDCAGAVTASHRSAGRGNRCRGRPGFARLRGPPNGGRGGTGSAWLRQSPGPRQRRGGEDAPATTGWRALPCPAGRPGPLSLLIVGGIFWFVLGQFADPSSVGRHPLVEPGGGGRASPRGVEPGDLLGPLVVCTPGLTYPQAAVLTESTTAVSNAPSAGAIGIVSPTRSSARGVLAGHPGRAPQRHLEQLRQAGPACGGAGHPRRPGEGRRGASSPRSPAWPGWWRPWSCSH